MFGSFSSFFSLAADPHGMAAVVVVVVVAAAEVVRC